MLWVRGVVYIGQMGQTTVTHFQEHEWHICLEQLEKSALAEHCIMKKHQAKFQNAKVLAKLDGCRGCIIRE